MRARYKLCIVAAAAALFACVLVAPVPAEADGPTNSTGIADSATCLSAVQSLRSSQIYKDAIQGSAGNVDFYMCVGNIAQVDTTTANGRHVITAANTDNRKVEDLSGLSPADQARHVGSLSRESRESENGIPMGSMVPVQIRATSVPGESTSRVINGTYKETLSFNMPYGQVVNGVPTNSTWTKNTVVVSLGSANLTSVTYSWTQMTNRYVAPTLVIESYIQNGIFAPSYNDAITKGSGTGSNNTFRTSYSESGSLLTSSGHEYHVELANYRINDLAFAHQFQFVAPIVVGHRYQCAKGKVCQFPGGKEAPVLG